MKTKSIFALVIVAVIGGFVLLTRQTSESIPTKTVEVGGVQLEFQQAKKSAHYESNTPAHEAVLAGVPINVVIDFNFDLAAPSSISITRDGKDYGVGETTIDGNVLAMRRTVDPNAPDGLYTVKYEACWPDKSCHNGHFQFAIDRTRAESYIDLRNQKEVTVVLADIAFAPPNIRVSKGTKVMWRNDDTVDHYVNTDSHPAHTYERKQNSRVMKKGDVYETTFDTAGVYPYHCSAHADTMTAVLLVE